MVEYVRLLGPGRLKAAFVVHGEEESSLSLADQLLGIGADRAIVPNAGQEFDLA